MKNRNVIVGLFVVSGVTLFTVAIFLIGSSHRAFTHHFEVYADFANVSGLTKGAKVQVGGLDAGEVKDISVPPSPTSKFRLRLSLEQSVHGLVRKDSVVTIATQGVVGDKLLMVQPGSVQAPEAAPGTTLPSKEPLDMSELLNKSAGLLNDASGTMKTVAGKLNGTLDAVTTTVNNANDLVVGIKEGKGVAGVLLRDPATAANVRQAVANVRDASAGLNHAAGQADLLVSDLQSRQLGAKVDQTMATVQNAATNLDKTSQQVQQTVTSAFAPDSAGVDAGTNIRQSLSSLAVATGNMAEDTEALKHEFFFRGFFRHRGYYSLSHLDPAKYRGDKTFTGSANERVWFDAKDLFQVRPNAQEVLSQRGKERLDTAVANMGDAVLAGAVVIEGYSTDGTPGNQLAISHSRSILVRQYLHNRFQLDLQNVGAVPLSAAPPETSGKTRWDGICILVLKPGRP